MKKTKDESPLSLIDGFTGNISGKDSNFAAGINNMSLLDNEDGDDVIVDLNPKSNDDLDFNPLLKDDTEDDLINKDSDNKDDDSEEDVEDVVVKPTKKSQKKDVTSNNDEENDDDIDADESDQIGLFFDAFSESLGWEVNEDEEKPTTIEGLINYMKDLVSESSVPEYSSDKIKELDEYVRNGGSFDDYYRINTQLSDLDTLDIENESVQKQICKQWLKTSGYTDSQIDRKISRWEDAGVLEDEATDSLELLKEHTEKEKESMIKEQEKVKIAQEKAQDNFYKEVVTTIDNLKEVRGIKIPIDDRKKLKDYAFKVESDGTTKYQKDYAKNISKNFIESAYFTMKGDSLVKSAKQTGETSAVSKLRQTMKNRTPGNSKHDMDNSSATPLWSAASSFFGVKS